MISYRIIFFLKNIGSSMDVNNVADESVARVTDTVDTFKASKKKNQCKDTKIPVLK